MKKRKTIAAVRCIEPPNGAAGWLDRNAAARRGLRNPCPRSRTAGSCAPQDFRELHELMDGGGHEPVAPFRTFPGTGWTIVPKALHPAVAISDPGIRWRPGSGRIECNRLERASGNWPCRCLWAGDAANHGRTRHRPLGREPGGGTQQSSLGAGRSGC